MTPAGKQEISGLHSHLLRENDLLIEALLEMDPQKAALLLAEEDRFVDLEHDAEWRHLGRITAQIAESKLTHAIHMELMDGLRQIHEYNAVIARTIHHLEDDQVSAAARANAVGQGSGAEDQRG